jgi:hypothetical protein
MMPWQTNVAVVEWNPVSNDAVSVVSVVPSVASVGSANFPAIFRRERAGRRFQKIYHNGNLETNYAICHNIVKQNKTS